ncbi:MFS transporter [Streptomyces roseolilacinus]|uniref:MFS transporter n=1 Tax=Streptomyces roseolilacinus TaxID=66904 RepID=A0A918B237_9ACTN|nr:MFS transporter [Streptomyces roseolilacinus]GGQ07118.1 MFS transporter [Streptomyces roseolilacinus]
MRSALPVTGAHRRLVLAVAIDTLGTGTWIPVSLLYFLRGTRLPLVEVGLALTVASLVALPMTALAGQCVDRYGAKRVLQAGNVLQFAGFAAHPFADSFAGVTLVTGLAAVGRTCFWTSFGPLVAAASPPGERERWFGFLGAVRNAGFAVGALVGGAAAGADTFAAHQAVVLLNALSFGVAFCAMARVPAAAGPPRRARGGGWRTVLRDRGYRWLLGCAFCHAMAGMTLAVAVPVYVVTRLGLPGWLSGAVLVVNTLLIAVAQGRVVTALTGAVRSRVLVAGAVLSTGSYALFWAAGTTGAVVGAVLVLAAAVVCTLGEMTADPVLDALAAETPPEALRGRYLAAFQLSTSTAGALAPALHTWLLGAGNTLMWGVLGAIALTGAACCAGMRRELPRAGTRITNGAEAG